MIASLVFALKHISELRRTSESDDADVRASVYLPHGRFLEKTREPRGDRGPILHVFTTSARVHQTLRVISAMEVGIADHAWSIEEIVALYWTRQNDEG